MHIHLSYFDLVLIAGGVGAIYWWRKSKKTETVAQRQHEEHMERVKQGVWEPSVQPVKPWSDAQPARNVQPAPVTATQSAPQPVQYNTAPSPVHHYHDNDSMNGMVTGMLLGEMIAGGGRGHDTTVVNNTTYVENGGSHVDHDNHDNYVDNGSWDSTPAATSSESSGWTFDIGGSDSSDSSGGIDFSIGSDC